MTNKHLSNCKPTKCGQDLLSNTNEFITEEVIKERCNCQYKATCFELLRLLKQKDIKQIDVLLDTVHSNEKKQ